MLIVPSRNLWLPGRELWTPRPRRQRWKNPPTFAMAEGDIVLNADGNFILDASGNLKVKDASPDCCCGCSVCSDPTPFQFSVTITGLTMCTGCHHSLTSGPTGIRNIDFGASPTDVSGTYTLTQSTSDPCAWEATGSCSTQQIFNDCSATGVCDGNLVASGSTLRLVLAKQGTGGGRFNLQVSCVGLSTVFNGFTSTGIGTCAAGPYTTGANTVTCGGSQPGSATGGTATITPL